MLPERDPEHENTYQLTNSENEKFNHFALENTVLKYIWRVLAN